MDRGSFDELGSAADGNGKALNPKDQGSLRKTALSIAQQATLCIVIGLIVFPPTAWARYNDYAANKPSAFRDYQQTMIWDSELLDALSGFQGTLMFSTGSCFSGGFVDDLTQLSQAAVVTANTWHGFGMSMYDFLSGTSDTYGFHDAYMDAFQWNGTGAPPTFEEAYLSARDTVHTTGIQQWWWGGVEFPQFAATGGSAEGTLEYKAGDRAILFSGMWAGNEYYISSWDYTIAGGRDRLMVDYGWDGDAIITLFSDGAVPPGRIGPWLAGAGTKANLIAAFEDAAAALGPGNTLVVFVIAHGRSSAAMTSRLMADRRTIEYLLIPNGRNIANDGATYPAATYGCTEFQITGLIDVDPAHYTIELPGSLNGWGWTLDPDKGVLSIQAHDPSDQSKWLEPGLEYPIRLTYFRPLGDAELGRGGWQLWVPEGGGGPAFSSDHGLPGEGWGIGEHVPGTPALESQDPSCWGNGWQTGGDGWILIPAPAAPPIPTISEWGTILLVVSLAAAARVRRRTLG